MMSEHDKGLTRIALSIAENATITTEQYFQHTVPRLAPRTTWHEASQMVHNIPASSCAHEGCGASSHNVAVSTSWPLILHIIPDTVHNRGSSTIPIKPSRTFSIHSDYSSLSSDSLPDTSSESEKIVYDLVGRILFLVDHSHYQAEVIIGQGTYIYDDIRRDGVLQPINDPSVIEQPDIRCVLMVYHRRTIASVSTYILSVLVTLYTDKFVYPRKHRVV